MTSLNNGPRNLDEIIADMETTLERLKARRAAERASEHDLHTRIEAAQRRRRFYIVPGLAGLIAGAIKAKQAVAGSPVAATAAGTATLALGAGLWLALGRSPTTPPHAAPGVTRPTTGPPALPTSPPARHPHPTPRQPAPNSSSAPAAAPTSPPVDHSHPPVVSPPAPPTPPPVDSATPSGRRCMLHVPMGGQIRVLRVLCTGRR
jgi:hypothetical protein